MTKQKKKWLIIVAGIAILGFLAVIAWQRFFGDKESKYLASGNGRIEAVEIDVAAKTAGRLKDILVREGELVTAGQVVAVMDTEVLEAQLRQAEAQMRQAQTGVETVAESIGAARKRKNGSEGPGRTARGRA